MKLDVKYKEVERPVESVSATFNQNELYLIRWLAEKAIAGMYENEDLRAAKRLIEKLKIVGTGKNYDATKNFVEE